MENIKKIMKGEWEGVNVRQFFSGGIQSLIDCDRGGWIVTGEGSGYSGRKMRNIICERPLRTQLGVGCFTNVSNAMLTTQQYNTVEIVFDRSSQFCNIIFASLW